MTLPLLANNVTYGIWWQETNQIIGIVNSLTDGQLVVNGAITFTNSQFSLSAPSQNITNTLALTAQSGNTLFLLSSNAVINGTAFITGQNIGLAVSNSANINQNLYVTGNAYTSNSTCYQTTLANNMVANVITITNTALTNNLVTNLLYVNGNSSFVNIIAHNIVAQQANVTQGLGVIGGVTSDFANLNFITSNNTVQLYGSPSLNSSGALNSTLFGTTGGQFRAVETSSGIIFRNDGNNFSLLTTGNVTNPYIANYNSLVPFQFNVGTGSVLIDGTGAGVTFGGTLTIAGQVEHASNITTSGAITANGPGVGLTVANSATFNGIVTVNNTFTVNQGSSFNAIANFINGINVIGQATFVSTVVAQSTFTVNGASNLLGIVTISNLLNVQQLLTASANQISIVSSVGEIQMTGSVGGSVMPYGQFRAVQGNYGVIFRNDGANMSFLQTPATIAPNTSTWNSFQPFSWSLVNGIVAIDGGGSGTTFGTITVTGAVGMSSSLGVNGPVGMSSTLSVAGAVTFTSSLNVSGVATISGLLTVPGVVTVTAAGYYFTGATSTLALATGNPFFASIYCPNGYVFGVGFFAGPDIRLKKNIETISPEEGKRFVITSNPVTFTKNDSHGAGFIAQEQIKAGYDKLVASIPCDNLEETIDEDGLVSKENMALNLNYDNYIAYLTAFGKWSIDKIEQLEKKLAELEKKIGG